MDLAEFDRLLEESKLPETTVELCLRGDLQAQWEQLDRDLAALINQTSRKLAGNSDETELAGQIRELEQKMQDSTITVRLRALERSPWRELIEKHEPRKNVQADRVMGVNNATFFDQLVRQCWVEPELDEQRLAKLLDKLTDFQFNKLADAAWGLNRSDVNVPFSQTASHITANSAETSRRQSGSASASNAGQGGNRKRSRSTSTTKKAS